MKIQWQGLTANIWFDDRDPKNRGWYAEYSDSEGVYSDSMKVWEGEPMPTRKDASTKAQRIAWRALKAEARRRATKDNPQPWTKVFG